MQVDCQVNSSTRFTPYETRAPMHKHQKTCRIYFILNKNLTQGTVFEARN